MKTFTLSFLLSLLAAVSCMPVWQPTYKDKQFAKDYLKRFYNMKEGGPQPLKSGISSVSKELMEMQKFFGLKITGKLDADTLAMMKKPRCGVPDVLVSQYTTYGYNVKWDRNNITYRIVNYTSDLPAAEVDQCIEKAIRIWADVTPLKFIRMYSGIADIMISFHRGDHGDSYPFDGPGNILAHAFAPDIAEGGGDAHFDEDETFTFRKNESFDLFNVAVHEFGHSLGLKHSNVAGALMEPNYKYRDPDMFVLPRDDVEGIQSIYGTNQDLILLRQVGPPIPNACDPSLVLDAVATLRTEKLFFKNNFFWRVNRPGAPMGHVPHEVFLTDFWANPPDRVDAAYEKLNRVFLFRGRQVWAFRGADQVKGYPTSISSFGFPYYVNRVNAALYDPGTRKTLFFVDLNYFSYDETTKTMDSGFPKPVHETFPGMTEEVTAALHYGGYTYLYSGPYIYQFSSNMGQMHMLHMLTNSYFLPCTYH